MRVDPSFFALFFALVIYTASHIAEIVRGSIQAVPRGQAEAADAVALSGFQKMWFVILPQALRIGIPPLGNQYLNLIKNSSLGAAIGYYDLTLVAKTSVGNGSPAVPVFAAGHAPLHPAVARRVVLHQRRQPTTGTGGTMSEAIVDVGSEPDFAPPPDDGPRVRSGTSVWIRRNLFRSPLDGLMTVVFGAIAAFVLYKTISFVFVTGRWEIIRVNLRLLLDRPLPRRPRAATRRRDRRARAWAGLIAGIVHARRIRHGASTVRRSVRAIARDLVGRFGIAALVLLYLLVLAGTSGPWITVGVAIVAAVLGRVAGGYAAVGSACRRPAGVALVVVLAAVPVAVYLYVVTAVGFDEWGGFLLNLFLAVVSIILCFPLGVLLALGRRSGLPLVRWMCTVYIEIIRGAPLFVLLLLANVALGFFVPSNLAPSTATRAIVVFTLFTAAYMAEIVRGGLQSVPAGPDRGGQGARPVTGPPDVVHRAAAGVAQRDPGPDRSADLTVQGHVARRTGDGPVRAADGVRCDHRPGGVPADRA